MALCDFHWSSKILGKQVQTRVLLPEVGKPPFATFYLLHGLSDDHTIWTRRTRLETYVASLPLIVVMPDGFRGFYTDNNQGPAYGQYIGEELIAQIERNFPARPARAARCIGGLSMGGYGALRTALAYPEKFVSANSHSGALLRNSHRLNEPEFDRVFGKRSAGTHHDLLNLARQCRKAGKPLPKLRIDYGKEDFLIDVNRKIHREFERTKLPHEYEEFPGSHSWDYWDLHVREAIKFHAKAMKLPTS